MDNKIEKSAEMNIILMIVHSYFDVSSRFSKKWIINNSEPREKSPCWETIMKIVIYYQKFYKNHERIIKLIEKKKLNSQTILHMEQK